MVPVPGRFRSPLLLLLVLEAAVIRDNCHMLYHFHSVQAGATKQLTHKVIRDSYRGHFSPEKKHANADCWTVSVL
jgi:hypothetical protein